MARQTPARATRSRASRGREPKHGKPHEGQVPEVYQEMLEEAEARDPEQFHTNRPIKRRKVGDTKAIPVDTPVKGKARIVKEHSPEMPSTQQMQTVYDSTTEDESDIEWEDVDVQQPAQAPSNLDTALQGGDEPLQITFDKEPEVRKKVPPRRKPVTAAEKKLRLDIHKVHLLCLLGHVNLRNLWCNDDEIQVLT
ncbi:hypothetical protein N7478_003068 [Penicillium angulare]|uniref:uncharacterized protein n=1 Tax=Penicillium angulare TaxID=116970 RepID=UPI0025400034|nr:uncharacterized protein N7478_003068 [Penicillium angulare]KAJ5287382.1 hypothetical protein N7478_003068 [Penicillium angulare]